MSSAAVWEAVLLLAMWNDNRTLKNKAAAQERLAEFRQRAVQQLKTDQVDRPRTSPSLIRLETLFERNGSPEIRLQVAQFSGRKLIVTGMPAQFRTAWLSP